MPMSHHLSPNHAKRIAAYGRGLKELRLLTPHDFAVLDAMLWTLRKPGEAMLEPKYADIARKAGVKRDAAINAVKKLVQFGLLTKAKQWLIVPWGVVQKQPFFGLHGHAETAGPQEPVSDTKAILCRRPATSPGQACWG